MEQAPSTEFALKQEHHRLMKDAGCDIDKIIDFRRDVHQHAELAFKEVRTSAKIREMLLSFGIEEEFINLCAGTGLVVDIVGTGEEIKDGV